MTESTRPSREETWMEIAHVLRKRSTCKRGKVGGLLIADSRIIASGYNGSPPGAPHCEDIGCDVPLNLHGAGCQRTLHCEANLVAFAARHGSRTEGSSLFCTHGPCLKCAQLIIAAGIVEIVYEIPYRLSDGLDLLMNTNQPMTVRRYVRDETVAEA